MEENKSFAHIINFINRAIPSGMFAESEFRLTLFYRQPSSITRSVNSVENGTLLAIKLDLTRKDDVFSVMDISSIDVYPYTLKLPFNGAYVQPTQTAIFSSGNAKLIHNTERYDEFREYMKKEFARFTFKAQTLSESKLESVLSGGTRHG